MEALIATSLHLQFPLNSPAVQLAVHTIRGMEVLLVKVNKLGDIGLYVVCWQRLRQRVPNLVPAWPFDGEG